MKNILTIIKKELKRVFTDRGMILSLFIIPPLTIYLIYSLMGVSAQKQTEKYQAYEATVYVINAPDEIIGDINGIEDFKTYLESLQPVDEDDKRLKFNVSYFEELNEEDIEGLIEKVENEEVDLIIEFPVDFVEKVLSEDPSVSIALHYNINNTYSKNVYYDFYAKLLDYETKIVSTRVEMAKLKVFNIFEERTGDEEKAKASFIAMILPLLLVIYLMAGSMGVGIESIAGEKERGTIATLLVTPIKRSQLAIGKIISISIISVLSSFASFIGLVAVLPQFSKISGESLGNISYTPMDYVLLLLIMVASVLFFVSLIVIVSTYAKSIKQASALIMPIYLIVMGAGFLNMFSEDISQNVTQYLIPVYNVVIALKALFLFDLSYFNAWVTIIATFVYTIVLVFIIQKMFRSEKIMFNK